jgi:epoxyqueuosine reductase QueG
MNDFIQQLITRIVLDSPLNFLEDFQGIQIFQAPIVGVADGDDPLFDTFLKVVSPQHIIPRDFFKRKCQMNTDMSNVTVVSWALPFTEAIRGSNRSGKWPSHLYSLARNNGGSLIYEIIRELQILLRKQGKCCISPVLTNEYNVFRSERYTFSSNWSERHIAYAAGLGRFCLNGSLITPVGANVRFGSVITTLPLKPTRRLKESHMSSCLENKGVDCHQCINRCPVNAITREGLDKERCYARKKSIEARFMADYSKTMKMYPHQIIKSGKRREGYSLGCAICQTGVPCESKDPYS